MPSIRRRLRSILEGTNDFDLTAILESANPDIGRMDHHITRTQSLIQEAKDRIKELENNNSHSSDSEVSRKLIDMYTTLLRKDERTIAQLQRKKQEMLQRQHN